jgi:hypothetical protein
MKKPKPVTRKQVLEWVENPVTLAFKYQAELEWSANRNARGLDAFHPFQPERTQEIWAGLNGAIDAWEVVIAALDGEGIMNDEQDEEARFE